MVLNVETCMLLYYIEEYVERKKHYFTYNEIILYILWHNRKISITTLERQLRRLAQLKLLHRIHRKKGGVIFYPIRSNIYLYKRKKCNKKRKK